jgi:hypothetical protein
MPITPTSSLDDILQTLFGAQYGPALTSVFSNIKIPSTSDLQQQFQSEYNPYFNELTGDITSGYNTGLQRAQQDLATQQAGFDFQANQANRQAQGNANLQFGEAFGSPLQQRLEQERANELRRQRRLLQQNFDRRSFDLSDLLRRQTRDLEHEKKTAQGQFVAQRQYANLDL